MRRGSDSLYPHQLRRTMKKAAKKSSNANKIIGGSLIVIGVVIIALLAVILVKTMRDEDKYTISYRSDDRYAEKLINGDKIKDVVVSDPIDKPTDTSTSTTTTPDTSQFITVDKALDIALKAAGTTKQNVRDIDVELDYKFGQTVYEVSFDLGQYDYEYYLDAKTGNVIKSFKEIDY